MKSVSKNWDFYTKRVFEKSILFSILTLKKITVDASYIHSMFILAFSMHRQKAQNSKYCDYFWAIYRH